MTKVKFITEDECPETYNLHENRMFTSKVNRSIVWGGKGKDRVLLIKKLINQDKSLKETLEKGTIKDLKELI